MPRRWFPLLLALVFGLALLPATALARDHDRDWDHHRWSRDWDHDGYRHRQYRYYNNYNNGWNNGYHNNNYNRRWRCVDPDHDGDCDYFVPRHRHHHDPYYQNGWYQDGWYGNGYPYGSYAYPYGWGSGNGWYITPPVVGNGYYGNNPIGWNAVNPSRGWTAVNSPRGWNHGNKRGWGNSNLPPGLAKKSGWHW